MKENDLKNYYILSKSRILSLLESDEKRGLKSKEAKTKLEKYGKNIIESGKKQGIISKFFAQFKDLMIIILLISALISFLLSKFDGNNESADALIILLIVFVNGIIGTIQEYKAEKAIDALKKLTSPSARVLRDGKKQTVESMLLVPGDVVLLKSGDVCPADLYLLESVELYAVEASLTGEADAVHKSEEYKVKENSPLSERKNTVFASSEIISGHGVGVVINTGMNTEMGKIASMLKNEEAPETPLSKKLNYTSKILALIIIIICAFIFVMGILRGSSVFNMLMISISLAVAAIPEGLSAVVTIVLALGVKRMAKKNAIVRKPLSVETLGSTTVICSDKTGTLTENKMKLVKVSSAKGYCNEKSPEWNEIISLAALCNDCEVDLNGKVKGTPTEKAIMEAYIKDVKEKREIGKRVGEIPFTSKRKMMTTAHKTDKAYLIVSKGTPSVILSKCTHYSEQGAIKPMDSSVLNKIKAINQKMEEEALRVLAIAKRERENINVSDAEIEQGLIFVGFTAIEDPPRKEVKNAVELCKKAGIKPVMITGDQPGTALAIAKKTSIYKENSKIMSGTELKTHDAKSLSKIIDGFCVFASVSPEDKVKIVKAFEMNGETVAMTGDGVNDAPALKIADIGCAMGKNGTEVAKSAADMVLVDDNFSTIVNAVKEGRNIFVNIRKTIHFLISSNIGEVLLIFASFLMNIPVPLLPTQLLWVNLVTDSFPAISLGTGKGDENNMEKDFLEKNADVLSKNTWLKIIIEGMFIGAISLLSFVIGRRFFDTNYYEPIVGRTMCFAVTCLTQLVHAFNVSSDKSIFSRKRIKNNSLKLSALFCTVLTLAVISVRPLGALFKTVPLNFTEWLIVIILSLCPLIIGEIEKKIEK